MLYYVSKKLANNTHIRQSRPIHEILNVPSMKYNFHSQHKMLCMSLDVTVKTTLTLSPFCLSMCQLSPSPGECLVDLPRDKHVVLMGALNKTGNHIVKE